MGGRGYRSDRIRRHPVGGYFGHLVGQMSIPVPWRALEKRSAEGVYLIDLNKDQIDRAPTIDMSRWQTLVDREWLQDLYEPYGVQPYWPERRQETPQETTG